MKSGLIGDEELFNLCCQGWEIATQNLDKIVRRSMAVKIRLVQADPDERSQRAALNLGHTVGHAVELASGYRLRHGEAVAIGMLAEARLSESLGLGEAGLANQIAEALSEMGLPSEIPPDMPRGAVMRAMGVDKKRSGGKLRFALPMRIGEVRVGVEVDHLEERLWSAS